VPGGCFAHTVRTVEPTVLRDSRSRCACAASFSGWVCLTRKVRSGHYGVNFRDGDESTACYAVDLEDAVNAAGAMARKREL
jgi:hypothetical protein